mgnify:CR=1 FL=1
MGPGWDGRALLDQRGTGALVPGVHRGIDRRGHHLRRGRAGEHRAIQMRHGVFTEAITRLTKGVPAALSAPVLAEATRLLAEHAGATVASPIVDDYPGKKDAAIVAVTVEMVNDVLGTDFSADDIVTVLGAVELEVKQKDGQLQVMVPYWRHDLSIPEDVIDAAIDIIEKQRI